MKASYQILFFLFLPLLAYSELAPDKIYQSTHPNNAKLITEVTETGQKITGITLQYEDELLLGKNLSNLYQVEVKLDNKSLGYRNILDAYTQKDFRLKNKPEIGNTVFLVLDPRDTISGTYELETVNKEPMTFLAKDKAGSIITKQIVQSNKIPHFYGDRLRYTIEQKGLIKLSNGKTISPNITEVTAESKNVENIIVDKFQSKKVYIDNPNNYLNYRLYSPNRMKGKKNPLVIFLHGSGQIGNDNIAHLLSSRGAISILDYSSSFVLAPQYQSVFDPFDDKNKGQKGGIHWQTHNRRNLILKMIDETIQQNPDIDKNRIYLIGLSRGAEGAMYLLLDRPNFFAAALLMSGREAGTVEYIDGKATASLLSPIKDIPIWFFHSKEDKVSPVEGSRKNFMILKYKLHNKNVRYTEFTFLNSGDNGFINNNAHNTWDAVFNSPVVYDWLLQQKRSE